VTSPLSPLEALRRAGQQAGLPDFDTWIELGPNTRVLCFSTAQHADEYQDQGHIVYDVSPYLHWTAGERTCKYATTRPGRDLVIVAWPVEATP